MTLILSGTDGLSDVDGSAATPAIRGTDANTGIFFPAADTIAFSEGGVESMRIDSSGNVGIGTASPATKLNIGSGGAIRLNRTDNNQYSEIFCAGSGVGTKFVDSNGDGFRFFNTATQVATIDSSGNLQFNSGYGSVATAYGCRAWVNFNGIGTVAIRASGNVSSITDNGTGDYTLNFTTAMPDANYSVIPTRWYATDDNGKYAQIMTSSVDGYLTTSGCRVRNLNPGVALYDSGTVCVAIFR